MSRFRGRAMPLQMPVEAKVLKCPAARVGIKWGTHATAKADEVDSPPDEPTDSPRKQMPPLASLLDLQAKEQRLVTNRDLQSTGSSSKTLMYDGPARHTLGPATAGRSEMAYSGWVRFLAGLCAFSARSVNYKAPPSCSQSFTNLRHG